MLKWYKKTFCFLTRLTFFTCNKLSRWPFFTGDKMSQQLPCASVHQLGHFVAGEKVGHFVVLGQFVARKMPEKQWFFMSASVGHFVSGEEMGQFVWWDNLSLGRKWDILSDGTICLPKNAVGTICPWDKMSPNRPWQIWGMAITSKYIHKEKRAEEAV